MSFILDALKKSENERQRTVGPSLADAPLRRARTERPWWAVAVAALLIVNLGVLLVVLLRDKPDATAAAIPMVIEPQQPLAPAAPMDTNQRAEQPAMQPAPRVVPTPSAALQTAPANPAVHSLADEAGYAAGNNIDPQMNPSMSAAAAVPSGPSMVRPIQPPAVAPLPAGATFPSVAAQGSESRNDEVLPTAGDLAAGGTRLPDLKLDIHVFSKVPAERFVFVNMRKYLEGQTLQEGPAVEKITTEGVVLNQHGLRYVLPRQ